MHTNYKDRPPMERNFSSPVFYVKAKWRSFVLKECALSCRSGRQFRTKSLEILVLWFSTYTHTIVKHLAWVIVSKLIYLMVLNSSCAIVIDRYDCWDQFNHCWFQNINFFWSVSCTALLSWPYTVVWHANYKQLSWYWHLGLPTKAAYSKPSD